MRGVSHGWHKRMCAAVCVGALMLFVAAARAQPFAGSALRFTAANYVSIPHNAAYNLYPFTVSAWVRTTNFLASPEAIVSKYNSFSPFNGFSMHVYNGSLRAWFFRDNANYVWNPSPADGQGVNGGFIADGRWHHVVFAVDGGGGRLFVDGVLKGSMGWFGSGGIPTTTAPLHFGAIANFGTFLRGDVDEVSIWNYMLSPETINYIKFRRLNGNEPGLVSYWRLNEGAGTTVTETGPSGRTGSLVGAPQWITSTAPIALSPVAGTATFFDGLDDQLTVSHAPDLNAYPLTVTAWIRTLRFGGNYDAIVNKYPGGSGNGYSLHVQNGRLSAFYFNPNGGRVYTADPGFDGGFIADGQWHHVAFTVDASGGKLFIDGVQTGSHGWVLGAAGPPTDTNALSIGRYPGQFAFVGQIDEVAVWNRALTPTEIAAMHNRPLTGAEANLVAYWPMNEGAGNLALDFTGSAHTASLQSGAFWIGSLARLGDGSTHFFGTLDQATYGRLWANQASPNRFHFPINYVGSLRRFHDYGPAPAPLPLEIVTDAVLRNSGAQLMPLKFPGVQSFPLNLVSENANAPATNSFIPRDGFVTVDPVQLDSVNGTFAASIILSHFTNGGPTVTNGTLTLPLTPLLHFDGRLRFGSVDTIFTEIGNTPARGVLSGGGVTTLLAVTNNSGYLVTSPSHTYGTGAVWNVTLFPDGHAERTGNFTVPINAPQPDRSTISNLTFKRENMILTNTGLRSRLTLCLPVGFSWGATNSRTAASEYWWDHDFALGTNLLPVASVLSESYVFDWVEETKPFWIRGSGISWNIPAGEITLGAPASLLFVRESIDYALETNAFNIIEPQLRFRISNDGYFRGATTVNGPVTVRADSNGLALLSIDMALANFGQFRPHFPYSPRNGEPIWMDNGRLVISNDIVNVIQSAVELADHLAVYYARDCDETNCAGATTIGRGTLNFNAPGSDHLKFTPDGGLVGIGEQAGTQGLTWGYAGGTNFAQRTSTAEEAAYHMPGTFLRRSATTLSNELLPAVLLFTGMGNGVNTTYMERPGELAYADGFANYAGINFRNVAQGRSYIANQNTEWYELTPRSKYYARYGGISGIHESGESFEMNLYGYETSLQSYRLSYLDSENWQSRTDGSVHLAGPLDAPPGPAGFDQEFEELKFLCRGGLDSARVAPFSGEKYLSYWNTYFTPQSVQFRETNGDNCNLGNRFLVIGAETKLPFIPQKLHAALGFKPNGNLVTAADNVNGCDSRFPVPAQLSLQGPARGTYKIATAAHGYFNNWESPGKPERGFYNIVGKLDLPFFQDSKIHLHVEALNRTTANVFLMGGWRSADKFGTDEGWSVGTDNFFTKTNFDGAHRGFPIGVTFDGYRNSTTSRYHPRAQQEWLELVKFDYGLSWNGATHRFKSIEDARVELPILDVMSGLKDMTPGKVDIDFSQDIKLGLPRLKMLDFANDAIDEFNGPLLSVSNAVYEAFQGAVNSSGLTSGFRSMQRLLRDETDRLFRPVLDPVLNQVVSNIYPVLSNALASDAVNFLNTVSNTVGNTSSGLRAGIQTINGTTGQVNSVLGEVNKVLTDMDDTLGLFLRIIEKTNGERRVVRIVVQKIVKDQGPELGFVVDTVSGLADDIVNDLLADLDPTLAEIETELRKIRGELNGVRSQLALLSGDFNQSMGAIANNAQELNKFVGLAGSAVSNLMFTVKTVQADFFSANPEEAKRQLRERLFVAFLSSSMPAKYQETFKRFFYDDNALVNQLTETLFQQINIAVRNGLEQQLQSATDNTFNGMKGPGFMSGSLLAAKIRGAPTFKGDTIDQIRLDADVNMRLPDDMKFHAFMLIKQLDSQNTPISCIPAGGPAAEITLGATEVPLDWAGLEGGQTLDITARWSLQNNKSVYGVGGALELRGDTKVKSASISSMGAALAIGQFENYFAARAAGSAKGGAYSFSAELGFFAGRTCRPDPLKMVDPEVELMISNPTEFTGIYVAYGGKFPFTQLIGVPPSCFFRADGSMKTVLYYQGGPRLGMFGGRLKIGLDVELLCLLGAHVDYGPFLKVSGTELSFGGTARACGKLGVCPFCVEGCADLTIKGVVNDGGIDYFVDF